MNNNIIKIIDLLYITCVYVIYGIIVGSLAEKLFVKLYGHVHDNLKKYDNKSIVNIIIEIIFQMFVVAIIYYYSKILLSNIPIHNIISNDIYTIKSYDINIIFTYTFFSLQQNIEDKYIYLLNRINKYNLIIPKY